MQSNFTYSKAMSSQEISELRVLVNKTLERNLFQSAAFLGERLSGLSGSIADSVLHANCYFRDSQHRRCLAILEQRGYLSAAVVTDLGKILTGNMNSTARDDFLEQIRSIELAAQCLYRLEEYEDCVSLLQPLVILDEQKCASADGVVFRIRTLFKGQTEKPTEEAHVSSIASLYFIMGKCYDMLDHRSRAVKALTAALLLDATCVEAAEYLVDSCLLTNAERLALYQELIGLNCGNWLLDCYRVLFLDQNPLDVIVSSGDEEAHCHSSGNNINIDNNTDFGVVWLSRRAKYSFDCQDMGESYRLSRLAYVRDPYDDRALYVYIASMVELGLKTELFYLGHELVNSFPKKAMSWYAVGCYYWCCKKLDLAQKHLAKATKLDKRCSQAWILLGHVMACLEESEQAMAAFRTASRLLQGDHLPLVCMAKELVRANHLAPALHILSSALDICPDDPGLLNELGVTYLKQGSMDLALQFFGKAVHAVDANFNRVKTHAHCPSACETAMPTPSIAFTFKASCSSEIFSNYATALRKCERFEEALYWYDKCMATNPNDANCHASVGFTFHLMQRFDLAVSSYHQALAMQPTLTFCSDMLSRAMEDMSYFPSVLSADSAAEADHFQNFQRLSKYGLGADPVHSGELDRLADANRSLNASMLGCEDDVDSAVALGRDPDGYSVSGVPARYAEESYMSLQLSEMLSPGMSMAQSFSRIEGRLSLTPHHHHSSSAAGGGGGGGGGDTDGGWLQQQQQNDSGDFGEAAYGYDNTNSSCMTPSDHGGYLDNSFESH